MRQIDALFKKLTPKRKKEELRLIQNIQLPEDLLPWVNEYKDYGERGDFILKWIYYIVQTITLDEVKEQYKSSLWNVKFLIIMFVILIDDIADKSKEDNFLNKLTAIPSKHVYTESYKVSEFEQKYFEFTSRLWENIESSIKDYPDNTKYESIIRYDIEQMMNAMKYSYLVNQNPYLINKVEYFVYLTHNMQYIIDVMIDLACFDFDVKELGALREIIWYGQQMTRIGNWVSTWEREILDNDFTSGVFACAIESGSIDQVDLLNKNKSSVIEKIKIAEIEKLLLKKWESNYWHIKKLSNKVQSIDVDKLLFSLEIVMIAHLSSKGYK